MKRWVLGLGLGVASLALSSHTARAAEGESSFTPDSFVMPIYSVMLANGLTTNVPVYSCASAGLDAPPPSGDAGAAPGVADAGVAQDCLVDMADEAALASLFSAPADIPPGSYDRIVVGTCRSNSSFDAKVRGSVVLNGVTHYTTSSIPVISTDPADLDYATINYGGCGNTVMLPSPLTVAAGDTVTVNAFFTLEGLSWVLGNSSPGLGGCAVAPPGGFNVCSGLPVLVSYIGTAAPTLSAFLITEDPTDLVGAKAAGQVVLLSQGGEPFSGFLRRVYSETSLTPSVSYDVPLRDITRNPADADADAGVGAGDAAAPDGVAPPSYDVYAIGDPFQDLSKYRVRFPRFVLDDHVGTLVTANGAAEVDYRAIKR